MALDTKQIDELRSKYGINSISATTPSQTNKVQTGTARDFIVGAGKGLISSAVSTATGLNRLGQSIQAGLDPSKTLSDYKQTGLESLRPQAQSEISNMLESTNTAQKLGKVAGFGIEVLLPVGKTKVAENVIEKTPQVARKVAEMSAKGADVVKDYAVDRFPKLLSIFSGDSDEVVRLALKNPTVADAGIKAGDDALRKVVEEGSQKSIELRDAFVKGYSESKRSILGKNLDINIDKNTLSKKFDELLKNNNIKITEDGLDFTNSKVIANPGEIKKIQDARNALESLDSTTIDSIDNYKQLVGSLTRFADEAGGASKSPILGRFYKEIDDIIKANLPKDSRVGYTNLNKNFSENIDLYDEMVSSFNSGDPFTRLANSLGKNKDSLRQIISFYEKKSGKDVLPVVAGRELSAEKQAAFGFLNPRSWIDFFISPSKQASLITKIGEKFPGLSGR